MFSNHPRLPKRQSHFHSKLLERILHSALVLIVALGISCSPQANENTTDNEPGWAGGKADGHNSERSFEVLLTDPFCDECSSEEKAFLQSRSAIAARAVELIDNAERSVDAAQFTFSSRAIEEALYRASQRGVRVRVAMDHGQDREGSLSRRLLENNIDVRFVRGQEIPSQERYGLMHSKFMVVDGRYLLSGSNNWSSTGVSINEENTIVVSSAAGDPLVEAFSCHFETAWENEPSRSASCSTDDARFSPSVAGRNLIRDEIRSAKRSIHVLMHHFLFDSLLRELIRAAERGVDVRIVFNLADRETYTGGLWDSFIEAGGRIRYKRNNADEWQLMHHKLALIDGKTLVHGSGNWSGSAFFNNYEFFVRYRQREVVQPFLGLFDRLWKWSLDPETVDYGWNAARQHHEEHRVFFGNLHAHYEEHDENGKMLDDGELLRSEGQDGELFSVKHELEGRNSARYAWEYARDVGGMDFLALSPHVHDDRDDDPLDMPNMSEAGYARLVETAREINYESRGDFVALPSMEWNTLSGGNHVNIFGTEGLAKVERGRFDLLYEEFLPGRAAMGERPLLQFNHPRTFRRQEETLTGNWDQIYDINLLEIPNNSQRNGKFSDFGLDDYPPLSDVRDSWLNGEALPCREIVSETLSNIEEVTRPYLRLMEVTISRGTDISHEDGENPSMVIWDENPFRYTRVDSDWHYYLLQGFHLAPTANHDNHYANWGTGHSSRTAIIASELSEAALLDAMDKRRVYASEDENTAISFYADGRVPMGSQTATLRNHVNLNLYFEDMDHEGPFTLRLLRGRIGDKEFESITRISNVPENRWLGLTAYLPSPGEYFIYVVIHNTATDRKSWTAPIRVTRHDI